VERKKLS